MLLLLPATAILEPSAFARTQQLMAASPGFLWWLLLNSLTAYAVNLTNFMVTKHTSALTLQVGEAGLESADQGSGVSGRGRPRRRAENWARRALPLARAPAGAHPCPAGARVGCPKPHPRPPTTLPPSQMKVLGNLKGVIAAAVSVALFRNVVTVTVGAWGQGGVWGGGGADG